ncbi:MAG: tetratricopeptide repeat protein [Myxococcales bacterium]|nr:tetratricopeptide repeat protein [Myxococcales bacterium]
MDEGPVSTWSIDPDLRTGMRLQQLRRATAEGSWEEVILESEELLDETPDHPEALFLLGEALLEVGDWELARAAYQRRVEVDGGDAASTLGLAISTFHCCDVVEAAELAREAVRLRPDDAESHHVLALALERLPGRQTEATAEFLAAARMEPQRYPLPLVLKHPEWEIAISRALEALAPEVRRFYGRVPFRIEELPDLGELRSHEPPLSPVVPTMIEGTPDPDLDPAAVASLEELGYPATIRLFARNLCRAGSVDRMVEDLAAALQDEAFDWWGIAPEELQGT